MGTTMKKAKARVAARWFATTVLAMALPAMVQAQEIDRDGSWSATVSSRGEADLRVRVWRADRDHRWETSLKLDERTAADVLDGFERGDGAVDFTIEREAGLLRFEGVFTGSRGRGDFTFTENADFRSTMRDLGYGRLDDDEVFSAALLDVGPRKADEMAEIGFDRLDFDELVSASIFEVDADFVSEMERAGFGHLDFDELVSWRVHGIDADFVAYAEETFDVVDHDEITALKIHGLTEEAARELNDLGFGTLDFDDMLAARIHGLTPDFVSSIRELGIGSIDFDDALAFRVHGITPDFVRDLEDAGFEGLDADELVRVRIMGLDDILKKRRPARRDPVRR